MRYGTKKEKHTVKGRGYDGLAKESHGIRKKNQQKASIQHAVQVYNHGQIITNKLDNIVNDELLCESWNSVQISSCDNYRHK